jgi:hypothetical protein
MCEESTTVEQMCYLDLMHRMLRDGVDELVALDSNDVPREQVVDVPREQVVDGLRELAIEMARLEGVQAAWTNRLDAQQIYEDDAHPTAGICLADELRISRKAGNARVHLARELRDLPATLDALTAGRIKLEHARVLIGATNFRTRAAMLEDEAAFCTIAEYLPFDQFRQKVAEWSPFQDPDGDVIKGREPSRLTLASGLFGRLSVLGDFCAEDAAIIRPILEAEGDRLWNQEARDREIDPELAPPRMSTERHAEAFVNLLECGNGRADNQMSGPMATVAVVTTPEDLVHQTGGSIVGDRAVVRHDALDRFCCDSSVYRVVMRGPKEVIELGRAVRTAPPYLKCLLAVRDGGCVVPGCDRPPKMCHAHHVRWHANNGPTDIGNLVLLCRRHHTQLHKKRWQLAIDADQTTTITRVDGTILERHRSPAPLASV